MGDAAPSKEDGEALAALEELEPVLVLEESEEPVEAEPVAVAVTKPEGLEPVVEALSVVRVPWLLEVGTSEGAELVAKHRILSVRWNVGNNDTYQLCSRPRSRCPRSTSWQPECHRRNHE